jgi:hypothetical protein
MPINALVAEEPCTALSLRCALLLNLQMPLRGRSCRGASRKGLRKAEGREVRRTCGFPFAPVVMKTVETMTRESSLRSSTNASSMKPILAS